MNMSMPIHNPFRASTQNNSEYLAVSSEYCNTIFITPLFSGFFLEFLLSYTSHPPLSQYFTASKKNCHFFTYLCLKLLT